MIKEIIGPLAFCITGLILLADSFLGFLPKNWEILLLVVWGAAVLYFLVKSAVKEAVKEVLREGKDNF